MRALHIAWKDLRHTYRNLPALVTMVIVPLVVAGIMTLSFGTGDRFSLPQVETVVVDQDTTVGADTAGGLDAAGGPDTAGRPDAAGNPDAAPAPAAPVPSTGPAFGKSLTSALTDPSLAPLLRVTLLDTPEGARAAVEEGEADVAVIIPAGTSAALTQSGPSRAEVLLYKDPTLSVGPSIVATVVQSVIHAADGSRAAARAAVRVALSHGVSDPATLSELAARSAGLFYQSLSSSPPLAMKTRPPVAVGQTTEASPNIASQILVGMMGFFILFGASIPARGILDEHRRGTLPRLFTTPTSRTVIIGGKYMAVFAVVLLQSVILLVAGRLLFGAHWGAIGPVAVLTLCGALVASSLSLMVVSFSKTPAQAGGVSAAVFVFLGLLGGNFMGTASVGGAFALLRRLTPNGWLLEGWNHLLFGGSWASVGLPILVTLAFSLVFFVVATFFFRRRYA